MHQVTTPTTLPAAQRNAMVAAAGIRCTNSCERQATRWSNLCGLCERQWLEDHRPVWGKPTKQQLNTSQAVVRDHFAKEITTGVFDDWASQIGRTFARPDRCWCRRSRCADTGHRESGSRPCSPCAPETGERSRGRELSTSSRSPSPSMRSSRRPSPRRSGRNT
jgi:hypothetical protein